ncbi:hypothetical protein P20439_3187 [Pseudoalteromonas sp. BSi20439]|nr:hypothetical protein P20439_3187 [Pseudoalteromonas sp. BSi20439]
MARIFYSLALIIISPLIVFYLYVLRGKKTQDIALTLRNVLAS